MASQEVQNRAAELGASLDTWRIAACAITDSAHGGALGYCNEHGLDADDAGVIYHALLGNAAEAYKVLPGIFEDSHPDYQLIAASLAQVAQLGATSKYREHDEYLSLDSAPERSFLYSAQLQQKIAQVFYQSEGLAVPLWEAMMDGLVKENAQDTEELGETVLADVLTEMFLHKDMQEIWYSLHSIVSGVSPAMQRIASRGVIEFSRRLADYRTVLVTGMLRDSAPEDLDDVFDQAAAYALLLPDSKEAYDVLIRVCASAGSVSEHTHAAVAARAAEEPALFASALESQFNWRDARVSNPPRADQLDHAEALEIIAMLIQDIPPGVQLSRYEHFFNGMEKHAVASARYAAWESLARLSGIMDIYTNGNREYVHNRLVSLFDTGTIQEKLQVMEYATVMSVDTALLLFAKGFPLDRQLNDTGDIKFADVFVEAVRRWNRQGVFRPDSQSDAKLKIYKMAQYLGDQSGPMYTQQVLKIIRPEEE